jgi:flagellar protein FlgJ
MPRNYNMKDININPNHYTTTGTDREQSNKALKKACEEFESLFTYELLKSMRRTVDKCDLFHGGQGEEIYESLLDQELSKSISGYGSNSVSGMLYQQLKRSDTSLK